MSSSADAHSRVRFLASAATELMEGQAHDTVPRRLLELSTGQEAWDWMVFSNPVTEMIRDRTSADGVAALPVRLNIGWGRKADRL